MKSSPPDLGHALLWPGSLLPVAVAIVGGPHTPDAPQLLELGVQRLALLGLRPIWVMSGEHGAVDHAAQAFAAAADLPRTPLPAIWLSPGFCTQADPVPVGALIAIWDQRHVRTAQVVQTAQARALPVVLVLWSEEVPSSPSNLQLALVPRSRR